MAVSFQNVTDQEDTLIGLELELEIGPVAHGGLCVARHEGQVVFVRHTLPGERVRARVPDIAVRTTFITGFPGETKEDFKELLTFVRNVEFDRVGVFTYSNEEGTPAYDLPNKVDSKLATQRRARLMKEQAKISRQKNRARIGETVRVLFEGESKETELLWQGRMETQAPDIDGCVLINDAPEGFVPEPGEFVNVLIEEAHEHDLIGRIVT